MFFFEKKNQKTFIHWLGDTTVDPIKWIKVFFASFSSEKEDSSLPN